MIIATAGHVDHGKTSLVNALTGIDTDQLDEEKKRGLTIDLGFAYTDGGTGSRLGFVDVPGHTRFISNMLAGVAAIDYALLVVAADDGVMPQTVEHLHILELLGIKAGAVALTKIDRCEAAHIGRVSQQIENLLQRSFLQGADIFPLSTETGEGIDALKIALDMASKDITPRQPQGLFRLAIDRRFNIRGSGMVVTGSVFAGSTTTGDTLLLMPQNKSARVRSLRTQGRQADRAVAGDRCAVNIRSNELQLEDIHRGNWLTMNPGPATHRADISLQILGSEKKPFAHWTPVHIHSAANHVTGRIALLAQRRLAPGERGLAQLVFEPPINLCRGDRVIIRDQGALRTIGGGEVLDPYAPKRGRARPERLSLLKLIRPAAPGESIKDLLKSSPAGLDKRTLAAGFNLTEEELTGCISGGNLLTLNEHLLIEAGHLESAIAALKTQLTRWHQANPGKAGLPLNQIERLVDGPRKLPVDALIERLLEQGELLRDGNLFKRPGAGIQLSHEEQTVWQATLPLLQAEPTKPPVLHDLAERLSIDPRKLEGILIQVTKTGQLVRPVKNRFFLPSAITSLQESLAVAAGDTGEFTVQTYRDTTGIGRNLCIEILEYFDRQGLTRRVGDKRQRLDTTGLNRHAK